MRKIKKFLILLLFVIFTPVLIASASAEDASDLAMKSCKGESQTELNECALSIFKSTDASLGSAYNKIIARLNPEPGKRAYLIRAERSWITFREAECTFSASDVENGSMHSMISALCFDKLTRRRLTELTRYLKCDEGDSSCPVPQE